MHSDISHQEGQKGIAMHNVVSHQEGEKERLLECGMTIDKVSGMNREESAIGGETDVDNPPPKSSVLPPQRPATTRQSSRVRDKDKPTLEKAGALKASQKGTCSTSQPYPPCSTSIEEISKIYGFSLGEEEETRIANISLIQAKREAADIIIKTKAKLAAILEVSNEDGAASGELRDSTVLETEEMVSVNEVVDDRDDHIDGVEKLRVL